MKRILLLTVMLAGCTDNSRARSFGGTQQVNLPPNAKLVNATWKDADLWYLIRPMREGEAPEEWHFKESSNWGTMQGEVIFRESIRP